MWHAMFSSRSPFAEKVLRSELDTQAAAPGVAADQGLRDAGRDGPGR